MSLGLILWIVTLLILVFLFPATRKRYVKKLAKGKTAPPLLTYGSAVLAIPVAFILYFLVISFAGLASFLKEDTLLSLYISVGFFVFYFIVWLLILNILGKLFLKDRIRSDSPQP